MLINRLKPFVPLILLGILALARMASVQSFELCSFGGCDSITIHLKEMFLVAPPEKNRSVSPLTGQARNQEPQKSISPVPPATPQTEETKSAGVKWKDMPGEEKATTPERKLAGERKETERALDLSEKYGGRIIWMFLTLVCVGVCVAAWWVSANVILKPIDERKPNRWIYLAAAGTITTGLWLFLIFHPDWHMPIMQSLLGDTLQQEVKSAFSVIDVVNSFAYTTAIFVTIAIVAILLESLPGVPLSQHKTSPYAYYKSETKSPDTGLDYISRAMKRLQNLLYVATVMLVAGVLLERALFQWGLSFIVKDDQAIKAAQNLVSNIVAADGGFFTLALAVVYIPAALYLRTAAERLKGLPKEAAEKEKVLQAHGLSFSFTESVPKFLAILAPVLAGPIGELFSRLAK